MDLSGISTEDLKALQAGNLGAVSTDGLKAMQGAASKPIDPPSFSDRLLSSMAGRALKGANSVIEGGAEILPHALGNVASLGGMYPNPVSGFLFDESRRVRQMNNDNEAVYEGAKARSGVTGTDYMRGAGTIAGGAILGLGLPAAPLSTAGRAAYGAMIGGASSAFAPTGEVDDKRFGEAKALQAMGGAAMGAVATPIVGKVIDKAGPVIDKGLRMLMGGPKKTEAQILEQIRFDLGRENIDINMFPESARQQIAKEVQASLARGEKLDGAAALRKLDLDQFGGGTQGQITRNPAQWNREFNLRQIENAGEPLVDQAARVRAETGQRLSAYGGSTPETTYDAGNLAIKSLMAKDAPAKGGVDAAYNMARGAEGRYSPLNTQQFSAAANAALDEGQLGYVLPTAVKNVLNDVSEGKIPLNVNTATQIESFLSKQARDLRVRGEQHPALAVSKVLDALRGTDLLDDAAGAASKPWNTFDPLMAIARNQDPLMLPGTVRVTPQGSTVQGGNAPLMLGGPSSAPQPDSMSAREAFNEAKRLAAQRFATHEKVPALKAALEGDVAPEQFVSKYVLGGKVDDVQELAKFIPDEGKTAIRDQIAKHLERAAFGGNRSRDGVMAVEKYTGALDKLGKEKLNAFFPEEVVDDLYRIARVNSYVNQQPAGITPNRSGTAGAIANMLQRIQGVPVAVPIIRGIVNQGAAASALSPKVPSEAIPVITPALRNLLGLVPVSGGVLAQ